MTPGELKFALCVEAALNRIPEPEYRQLVVEMLMVLSLVVEYHPEQTLGDTIDVDELVWEGHNLYLNDQVSDMITLVILETHQFLRNINTQLKALWSECTLLSKLTFV